MSSTLVYSIAAHFTDEKDLKSVMGYLELSYSLGLTIGPVIGYYLYNLNGYSTPFYFCGILMFICLFILRSVKIVEVCYDDPNFFEILLNFVNF